MVRAQTNPKADAIKIYFKAVDPDDPSADGNEVDQATGRAGGDNKDTTHHDTSSLSARDALTMTTPEAEGAAFVYFRVSHLPGDNHRFAGTLKLAALTPLTDSNVPPSALDPPTDADLPKLIGDLSPLLTVWRKLHLDLDSFGPAPTPPDPTGVVSRNLDDTGFEDLHPGHTWAEINAWDGQVQRGRLEGGKLTVPNSPTYEIVDNIDDTGDDSIYVNGYILADEDESATAVDDDEPFTPRLADTSLVVEKLRPAYVDAIYDPVFTQLDMPFLANLSDIQPEPGIMSGPISAATAPGRLDGFVTSAPFWVAQVVLTFQGNTHQDFDPDARYHAFPGWAWQDGESSVVLGATVNWNFPSYNNACVIYTEQTRDASDWAQQYPDLLPPYDPAVMEPIVVIHEIGHQFGCEHPHGGIMGSPLDGTETMLGFTPESINTIRNGIYISE